MRTIVGHRGSALGTLIVVMLAGLLVGGGIWVYRTNYWGPKARQAIRAFSEWTAEKRVADPIGWLDFLEEQINSRLEQLKVAQQSTSQTRATFNRMLDQTDSGMKLGKDVTLGLRSAVRNAEASGAAEVEWEGQVRTRKWLEDSIKKLLAEIQIKSDLRLRINRAIETIDAVDHQVEKQRGELLQQLAQLKVDREVAKINKVTEETARRWDELHATVGSLIAKPADAPLPSLDDLVKQQAVHDEKTEAAFKKFMSE